MATTQQYYALLTKAGQAAMLKAVTLNTPVRLTHMAVGDANTQDFSPTEDMTALVNEVHRAPINALAPDGESAELLAADMIIPHEVGGWKVRELGIFDENGSLFAIASVPPTYKPQIQEGGTTELRFRMLISLDNADKVELIVDPTVVLATRDFVEKHTKRTDDPHNTIPEGGEAGQVLIKQADNSLAWGSVGGVPVGELCFSTTAKALPGTLAANIKQKVRTDVYPQLFEWMKQSTYLTDEAVWDAEAAAQDGTCGKYCWDGGQYFILPCYKHYFVAAQDGVAGKKAGDWQAHATEDLFAGLSINGGNSTSDAPDWDAKVVQTETYTANYDVNNHNSGTGSSNTALSASHGIAVMPLGTGETQVKSSYLLPCIKAFDMVTSAAEVNLEALVDTLRAHSDRRDDPHSTLPEGGEAGQSLIKQADGSLKWESVGGVPVGQLCFSSTNSALPGTVPVNVKQKFILGVYPQLEAWVRSATGHLTDEALWDAEAAAQEGSCGKYCLTDTHIILPCYKHYFAAAQSVAGKDVGDWAGDAIRNITGRIGEELTTDFYTYLHAFAGGSESPTSGAFQVAQSFITDVDASGVVGQGINASIIVDFDASAVVPTADENRPKTSYLLPCIKVSDVAVNGAQVDMLALAQQVAAINGSKADRSEVSKTAIATGNITYGETIPLPAGYTEKQCRFFWAIPFVQQSSSDDFVRTGTVRTPPTPGGADTSKTGHYIVIGVQ